MALPALTLNAALQKAVKAASKLTTELTDAKDSLKTDRATVAKQREDLNRLAAHCNEADARAAAAFEEAEGLRGQLRQVETEIVRIRGTLLSTQKRNRTAEKARKTAEEGRKAAEKGRRIAEEGRKSAEERYTAARKALEEADTGSEEVRKAAMEAVEAAEERCAKAEESQKAAIEALQTEKDRLHASEKRLAEQEAALKADEDEVRAEREALATDLVRAAEALRRHRVSNPGPAIAPEAPLTPTKSNSSTLGVTGRRHSFPLSSQEDNDAGRYEKYDAALETSAEDLNTYDPCRYSPASQGQHETTGSPL
ncbi:hypothetical protein DFH06DRAFT_1472480 [Mycena polygramma]|nr:hypothetical protein DFH06DRAFT_1472480 [Mycena polygramma]